MEGMSLTDLAVGGHRKVIKNSLGLGGSSATGSSALIGNGNNGSWLGVFIG